MLRLLFCTAAILPIGLIPWMTSEADAVPVAVPQESYAEIVTDPNLDALSNCEIGELPVFFDRGLVTTHSADFIAQGLVAAEDCGPVDVTIVSVLPEGAEHNIHAEAAHYTSELSQHIEAYAFRADIDVDLEIAEQPREEEISTLYMNGRAAILRIDPEDDAG